MPKEPDARERSMLDQLRDGLVIDKHELDDAWVEQPDIFWRVADQLAKANNARDSNKLDRDRIIATVDAELREGASKAGAKVTETSLAKEIELDSRVVDARAQYQRLCLAADRWQALKESYSQRSYALKDLTALHIANYYQTNSGGEQREQVADRVRRGVGEAHRRSKE